MVTPAREGEFWEDTAEYFAALYIKEMILKIYGVFWRFVPKRKKELVLRCAINDKYSS